MDRPAEVDWFQYHLKHEDTTSKARRGEFVTPHGVVQTPAFMPVGTQGTVKGLEIGMVRQTGAEMILGNTYHLSLRPGDDVVAELGGLHKFMDWRGPILTDSGGFQIFSLAQMRKITEKEAIFRSHIDGRKIHLSPERSIEIQENLGSDIAMVLDHVVELPNESKVIREAMDRSIRWAKRCQDAATRKDQAQFAIVQGGLDEGLRVECAERLAELNFPGYAIGGLSVGEPPPEMYRILDATCPVLPTDKPRYLMGVGRPEDLLEGIRRGVDLFDCVMPTRNGRNALAFTDQGTVRLRNSKYQRDSTPLDPKSVPQVAGLSRAYFRHLFMAKEMLGPILLSLHNVAYYQRLMREAQLAIEENRFEAYYEQKMAGWASGG
ncbi:tRNA guanosine(34) transglycosylase Tgt [Blastopirellula marina]|uniref:Queuine tRNA-ribosyltransferase n=1 Tax=Blastopirellula marina TaxID=124 RepID=A0A2S8F262_9BACT|nr:MULTISPECIES: tRNA guanosine(34) transglycosylase Tgt [Pirellulaceae]PQO26230.1 tRNA guanosine(34) transglycosylase Tgt [Blastopirellula marina]RCS44588.1 tRNA guanosine(34) transglycosylase Tgt [Bremerella cremea]